VNAIIQIFKIQVAEIKKNARNVLEKKKKDGLKNILLYLGRERRNTETYFC